MYSFAIFKLLRMSETNPTNQIQPYYSSLIDSYTKSILNSGLLVDEDLEVLLAFHKPYSTFLYKYRPSLKLPASVLTLLGSTVLVKKLDSKLVWIPAVLLTTLSVASEIFDLRSRRLEERLVDDLIDTLNKIRKINSQVISYTKTRQELKPDELSLQSEKIADFFRKLSETKLVESQIMIGVLYEIGSTTEDLVDDMECLKFIDLPSSLSFTEMNIGACFSYSKRVQDIQIWLTSKLLGYIGIVFNSSSQQRIKHLLIAVLPQLLSNLKAHFETTHRLFNHLRESARKWSEYRSQRKHTARKKISTKLENTIASVVDNLSLISENSMGILNQLDSSDADPKKLNKSLLDLRQQTYATYESIDLLCKLYGIMSNIQVIATKQETNSKPAEARDSNEPVSLVRYDDQMEPVEEQFDLYIDKDDAEQSEPARRYSGDSSGAYVGLMLQELKQSLKQHARFVEAKKRRGSEDEEEVVADEVVPTFDLTVLRTGSVKDKRSVESAGVGVGLCSLPPMPPPLPPKLFDLSLVGKGGSEQMSMVQGIEALSSQLSGNEEVFGAD